MRSCGKANAGEKQHQRNCTIANCISSGSRLRVTVPNISCCTSNFVWDSPVCTVPYRLRECMGAEQAVGTTTMLSCSNSHLRSRLEPKDAVRSASALGGFGCARRPALSRDDLWSSCGRRPGRSLFWSSIPRRDRGALSKLTRRDLAWPRLTYRRHAIPFSSPVWSKEPNVRWRTVICMAALHYFVWPHYIIMRRQNSRFRPF